MLKLKRIAAIFAYLLLGVLLQVKEIQANESIGLDVINSDVAYSYSYDLNGRLLDIYDSQGNWVSQKYDMNGNLREIVLRLNVASGKNVTAGESAVGRTPEAAVDTDGTNNSFWGATTPTWWKVDLGGTYEINKIVIRNFVDGVRHYKYTIETSIDGINWSEVVSKQSDSIATDEGDVYDISPVHARYLRVNMQYNSANEAVHITDFRVYGQASPVSLNKFATAGESAVGRTPEAQWILMVPKKQCPARTTGELLNCCVMVNLKIVVVPHHTTIFRNYKEKGI